MADKARVRIGHETLRATASGDVYTRVYWVDNAAHPWEARTAPGIPKMGDPVGLSVAMPGIDAPVVTDIRVTAIDVEAQEQGETKDSWKLTVTWSTPTTGQIDPTKQSVRWSFGQTSQKVLTSLNGNDIGLASYVNTQALNPLTLAPRIIGLADRESELGVNVAIGSLDIEVTMPAFSPWNPLLAESLQTTVNKTPFLVDGITIAPGFVRYEGAEAASSSPTQQGHQITHRFTAGSIKLPTDDNGALIYPAYIEKEGSPGSWLQFNGAVIGIAYALWPTYKVFYYGDNEAKVYLQNNDPERLKHVGKGLQREIRDLRISRVHERRDFAPLGII